MKLIIDTKSNQLIRESDKSREYIDLFSRKAFELISLQWLRIGWNQKYTYTFSWLGRPVIQLPEDLIRAQEVIFRVQPDVIIETGVAHGGSLIFYASLCKLIGRGSVIGIDLEIRPHNRRSIEEHALFPLITLVEGDSTASETVEYVKSLVEANDVVMVLLDSNHSKEHVMAELEAYHDLVTPDSFLVATDGIMKDLGDAPRSLPEWAWDHPAAAASDFVASHPEFVIEQPAWPFNESELEINITHWPSAWLRRSPILNGSDSHE